jgi:hypothetical protein
VDGIRLFVWDLDAEFLESLSDSCSEQWDVMTNLLNCHDHLNGVETVQTQIVVEMRFGVQL